MSASELRREAVRRLAFVAGYDERLDVEATLARRPAVDVLVRQALRAAADDELLLDEIRELAPIAGGRAWVLDDALHEARALPEPTPDPTLTLAELEATIKEVLS